MKRNVYTTCISYAKIVLPLCGVLILSTMFLWSWQNTHSREITAQKRAEISSEAGLIKPRVSGLSRSGQVFSLQAEQISQTEGQSSSVQVSQMALTLLQGPQKLEIFAEAGVFEQDKQRVTIENLARVEVPQGYSLELVGLVVDLKEGELSTGDKLEVRAPFGRLSAGQLRITNGFDADRAKMIFTGGVKMSYTPRKPPTQGVLTSP